MQALAWIVAITVACYVFWRVLRVLSGLAAATDPERPLFQSERGPTRSFFAPVEGVMERNADGTQRQDIIDACQVGEPLRLVPAAARGAALPPVRVCRWEGEQIGTLPGPVAAEVSEGLRRGLRVEAAIAAITRHARFRPDKAVLAKITAEVASREPGAARPLRPWIPPAAP
jgi:hypothetical protein